MQLRETSFNVLITQQHCCSPYTAITGKIAGAYTRSLNVCTQMKVMIGADCILLPSMYPAAPATIHPTATPTITDAFFRNGDPNSSVRMMLTKDRNPRPMNSGEPQGSGRGAAVLGQSWKGPDSGRCMQLLDPPPQFAIPEEPIRDAPTMTITVPVTMGGKTRFSVRAGMKDMSISRKAHTSDVPEIALVRGIIQDTTHSPRNSPYASGQAPLVTVPSSDVVDGQVPSAYNASKTYGV